MHNDDILIRPADNGSGMAVIDKEDYIESLEKEMEQSSAYKMTDTDRNDGGHKKVKKLVNKLKRDGLVSDDLKKLSYTNICVEGKIER